MFVPSIIWVGTKYSYILYESTLEIELSYNNQKIYFVIQKGKLVSSNH